MKRFALAALAAATFVAPLSIASPAAADRGHDRGHDRGWDRNDRDYDNRDDRRDERRAYRNGRHDERRADRWDDRRYNGYWRQGRFYYGPPPSYYREDVRYDYRHFRRGDRIPAYYRDRYHQVDYRRYGYAPPPRGYHYVRNDDSGETLLVGLATGVILGVILANN